MGNNWNNYTNINKQVKSLSLPYGFNYQQNNSIVYLRSVMCHTFLPYIFHSNLGVKYIFESFVQLSSILIRYLVDS